MFKHDRVLEFILATRVPEFHGRRVIGKLCADSEAKTGGEWMETLSRVTAQSIDEANGVVLPRFTVLLGERGRGKTQMAVEILRAGWQRLKERKRRTRARYYRLIEFFQAVKAGYDGSVAEQDSIARFRLIDLLVLDECQVRNQTAWEDSMLTLLVDYRYSDGSATILIANQNPDDFRRVVGESVWERICERGEVIECDWESFR